MPTYRKAGVDIAAADKAKRRMAETLRTEDPRILNQFGAFATLVEGSFPGYEHPVLVLKMEEPGSKQKLAIEHGRIPGITQDLVHHLINDIAVMGATPLFVQDAVICGKLDPLVVEGIVEGLAAACKAQGCTLVGGETSEQPGVVPNGTYILTASVVGIVEKARIIDGSKIRVGDTVLAVSSNGLHTNGYSLVRKLIEEKPEILKEQVGGESFLDVILKPHTCYYHALRDLFALPELHGMAHITGGGIGGNLNRILPKGTAAAIDLAKICMLPIFGLIKRYGGVPDADMLQTYNLGIGLTLVIDSSGAEHITAHLKQYGHTAYSIGEIVAGGGEVRFNGALQW